MDNERIEPKIGDSDGRASTTQSSSSSVNHRSTARREESRHSDTVQQLRSPRDIESIRSLTAHLSRTETQRLQHIHTVGDSETSRARVSSTPLPQFGGGKPYPPPLPSRDEYVVDYNGPDDPLHPQNWATRQKYDLLLLPTSHVAAVITVELSELLSA